MLLVYEHKISLFVLDCQEPSLAIQDIQTPKKSDIGESWSCITNKSGGTHSSDCPSSPFSQKRNRYWLSTLFYYVRFSVCTHAHVLHYASEWTGIGTLFILSAWTFKILLKHGSRKMKRFQFLLSVRPDLLLVIS